MWTEGRTGTVAAITLAATLLLWPALWNGYPLVFSDTGTYLSQAIEHYAGWDRPVFYSVFLLPLHLTLTTWPVILAQGLLVAYVLHLVRRTLLPHASVWWLVPISAAMALASPLPWFVSLIMPDVFTGALVLVLALLIFASGQLSRRESLWLMAFATFMIATHQSHVPLAFLLLAVLLPPVVGARRYRQCRSRNAILQSAMPLALAIVALASVNMIAFGRASLSPFGNVFLLTRVIYDGPGADVLRRDCPASGWRLCAFIDRFPATADAFLWRQDGPVVQAGGAKLISREADAIIIAALRAQPGREVLAFARNVAGQLAMFATGDGLQPWPTTVTPVINHDFPPNETAAYAMSLQNADTLAVPSWLQALHLGMALFGVTGCLALLLTQSRKQPAIGGFAAAALVALLANAAITGGLSGPHDRYQSRIMWLPTVVAVLGLASLRAVPTPAFGR